MRLHCSEAGSNGKLLKSQVMKREKEGGREAGRERGREEREGGRQGERQGGREEEEWREKEEWREERGMVGGGKVDRMKGS